MSSKKNRILCFGASLTEGFVTTATGIEFHPYCFRLAEILDEKKYDFAVDNQGKSGEGTKTMIARFKRVVDAASYTIAVVLGGTNDLGTYEPSTIFSNLKAILETAKQKGIIPVAVTIPETAQEKIGQRYHVTLTRTGVNDLLKKYCAENSIAIVDLATIIPRLSLSPTEESILWSDINSF